MTKEQDRALATVAEFGRSVSQQEITLMRTKRERDMAIRDAIFLGVSATRIASAAHLTRDMIYKLARKHG